MEWTKESADAVLRAREVTEETFAALVAVSLSEPDGAWVQDHCMRLLDSPDPQLRALAATSLGHVARIHPHLDHARAVAALERLRQDEAAAGAAEDALEDIALFTQRDGSRDRLGEDPEPD